MKKQFEEELKKSYKIKIQLLENDSIIEKQILDFEQILDKLFQSSDTSIISILISPERIERLNAYYFLAINAYVDNYSTSIYKMLIEKYSEEHLFELLIVNKLSGDPITQLNSMRKKLEPMNKIEFNPLLKGTSWNK
ncbi:MAG: hypothetical protein GF308_10325 [Candidatus Heimdallarchaeota archaeon]|nr:hypothetical protein [Candidatus Heimdallarchaeota archaeon]